jgi:predicted DNA-binding transcriptional regulator YafY
MNANELLPTQRGARIMWHLCHGETFRTVQIAEMFGISRSSAYRMMCLISECAPIHVYRGTWQVVALRELGDGRH